MSHAIHLDTAGSHAIRANRVGAWRGGVATLINTVSVWHKRSRQRIELMALARDGFDFRDLGITRALAVREATRFPWQSHDAAWSDVATGRERASQQELRQSGEPSA
jgi:uncharacterized protein YjiS (DUF1127 family)